MRARSRCRRAGEQILELRKLDLPLALARAGPPREDVENQLRAVDDLAVEPLLQLSQLGRCQLVVEDHEVDSRFRARCSQAQTPRRCQ